MMNAEKGIRNHFSIIFVDTFKMIWVILLFIVLNVLPEASGEDLDELGGTPLFIKIIIIAAIALFIFGAFFINYLHWKKTYIVIDDENLIVNNNYFWQKKVRTVRLSSIATVNFQQGIPERIFGTYKLQVDINSSVTANKTDFNLVFDKATAEKVKAMLTENAQMNATGILDSANAEIGAETEVAAEITVQPAVEPTLIYKFSFAQVLRHCALGFSFMSIFIIIGTAASLIFAEVIDGEAISGAALIPALVVVIPLIWLQIAPLFNYYDFKIEKLGERVIVSYGLFTHRQYNLPLDKTNAIIIHQPLFARMFGFYYGELINVGMGDEDNNGIPIFCLCVKEDEMREIIKQIKPELQVGGIGERSPKAAIIPAGFWYFVIGIIAIVASLVINAKFWWVGVLAFIYMSICAFLSYKTKALAVLSDKAVITTGVFHKRTVVVPNNRIQNIYRRSGPIARKLGLAAGRATILAAATHKMHDIGYFNTERYNQLFNNIVDINDNNQ